MTTKVGSQSVKRDIRILFAGPHIGHHVPPGWLSIVSELCAQIDGVLDEAERRGISFAQIKEKLGGLRCYLNVPPVSDLEIARSEGA
jgi:hypothetical protein